MNSAEFPEVDLVIPFHRFDALLFEALDSARLSVGVNLKLILVNDTGTKIDRDSLGLTSTDLLLDSYGTGYINALKTGILKSSAPFVAFLDSDDLISHDRLRLQIDCLQSENADFVSCELVKLGFSGPLNHRGKILGELPRAKDRRLLLLLGAHGADSTLLTSGESLRTTWKMHSLYDSTVADFGWLLQALQKNYKIVHEPKAKYFYRSHPLQLSRNSHVSSAWEAVWPVWEMFRSEQLTYLKKFNSLELSVNVALALVFPSALVDLNIIEIRQLRKAIEYLLDDLNNSHELDLQHWKRTLWRRYILAGKIHAMDKINYAPGLIFDSVFALLFGNKFRSNK